MRQRFRPRAQLADRVDQYVPGAGLSLIVGATGAEHSPGKLDPDQCFKQRHLRFGGPLSIQLLKCQLEQLKLPDLRLQVHLVEVWAPRRHRWLTGSGSGRHRLVGGGLNVQGLIGGEGAHKIGAEHRPRQILPLLRGEALGGQQILKRLLDLLDRRRASQDQKRQRGIGARILLRSARLEFRSEVCKFRRRHRSACQEIRHKRSRDWLVRAKRSEQKPMVHRRTERLYPRQAPDELLNQPIVTLDRPDQLRRTLQKLWCLL